MWEGPLISNLKFLIYLELGIWNLEFGIWNLEFGIWNFVLRSFKLILLMLLFLLLLADEVGLDFMYECAT